MYIPGQKTQTELSSRTTAFFSWIEFIGFVLFLISRFAMRNHTWLLVLAVLMVASGYVYKTYTDWKAGRKKRFRLRVIILVAALLVALAIGYRAGQKQVATPEKETGGAPA